MTLLVSVLVAAVLQWLAVAVARRFLRQHRERPLAAVWPRLRLLGPGFVLLAGGLAWLEMSAVDLLFSLTGGAFLALFIYLDVASRCLPQCFTVAFALTGGLWRLLVRPESVLLAAVTAGVLFALLWRLRAFAARRAGEERCGLGDVYLMAALGLWFSCPLTLWLMVVAALSGSVFLLARRLRHPQCWRQRLAYRTVPFAPFLCGVAALLLPLTMRG